VVLQDDQDVSVLLLAPFLSATIGTILGLAVTILTKPRGHNTVRAA
jgi:hypothetical protein